MKNTNVYQNCAYPAERPDSLLDKLHHVVKLWVAEQKTAYAVRRLDARLRRDIGVEPETEEDEYYSSYRWWRPYEIRFRETER